PLCRRPDQPFRGSWLIDHLNDATRSWFDQYGLAIHHGVAIGRCAERLRHVVIGYAGFRQHRTNDHALGDRIIRHPLAHDIFTEGRTPVGGDPFVFTDDHRAASDDARGDRAL